MGPCELCGNEVVCYDRVSASLPAPRHNPSQEEPMTKMMLERLNDYDWMKAFEVCGRESEELRGGSYNPDNEPAVSACLGYQGPVFEFTRADVQEIVAIEDGEADGESWIGVFRVAVIPPGRSDRFWFFAFVTAGCDYTGWDCQSGDNAMVHVDLDKLWRLGLGDSDRERLDGQYVAWRANARPAKPQNGRLKKKQAKVPEVLEAEGYAQAASELADTERALDAALGENAFELELQRERPRR
jgi:hypothetical protein